MTARNLALETLKACTIYACAGGDGAMKNRHLAAISALEAETGDPVAPYAWCIASTNSADWCFAAERSGVELNAFMMDKDCVKTPAFPLYTAPPPAVPQGWKLVPIEPTPEMWKAGLAHLFRDVDAVWRAMLAEVPEAPK